MLGVTEILSAAKRELGDRILKDSIRCSCPTCGTFLTAVLVAPNLVRDRCPRCRVDVIILVGAKGDVLATTQR